MRIAEQEWKETVTRLHEWLNGGLFSLQWWILLVLLAITAFIWWKIVDKTKLTVMVMYSAINIIFIIILDEIGMEFTLWYYPVDIIFLFPPSSAIDMVCMPTAYMIVYRYFRTWKNFIIVTLVMAAVFCFVFEPIFIWGGFYRMLNWKSYYGYPIYVAIAFISKFLVERVHILSSRAALIKPRSGRA